MELARQDRPTNLAALAKIRDSAAELVQTAREAGLCPKGLGEVARVGVEAATLLARYSDGDPGAHNVPPPPEEASADGDESFEPPPLDPAVEAAIDGPRGGDAGSPGEGNGGAA